VTREELHIVQHSLGCDQYGRGTRYRNHFCASSGPGSNVGVCESLVAQGLMRERRSPSFVPSDMRTFHVTDEGIAAMERESPSPPKVSRSKARYAAFLAADCGLSFGEWLRLDKTGHARSRP
jgi:hypothetical protein